MNMRIIYLFTILMIFGSCDNKFEVIPSSKFAFDFQNSSDQKTFDRDDAISQNSRGLTGTLGYQTIGAITRGANLVSGGLKFKFNIETENSFSTEEFLSFFQEGKMFTLGDWQNDHALYFGLYDDSEDRVIQYVSTAEGSNILEILTSPECIGVNDDDEDFYKLEVSFRAKMKNEEDETDTAQIENGIATLYVVDFSSK